MSSTGKRIVGSIENLELSCDSSDFDEFLEQWALNSSMLSENAA
jgi:hypothetical protein